MSVISVMAAILQEELQDRGIYSLTRHDCEAMVHRLIERTAEKAELAVRARARTEQD
jgi:hypothetical protein